jgi:hypothetical protein
MPDIAKESAEALVGVMEFYKKMACPCAFPRFGQLAGFDFHRYGTGPVGCHLTDILIELGVAGANAFYKPVKDWAGNNRLYTCSVCGSEISLYSEQFNIHLTVMNFTVEHVKAKIVGAQAEDRIPIPNGFYGFGPEDIAKCGSFFKEATVDEMADYLKALA